MFRSKILAVLSAVVIAFSTMSSNFVPLNIISQQTTLPASIAGYKVLGLFTPADISCMPAGQVLLILQSSDTDVQTQLARSRVQEVLDYLNKNPIAVSAKIRISISGPAVSADTIQATHQQWNNATKLGGCAVAGPIYSTASAGDWTEQKVPSPAPGWAVFQDTDAGVYTNANAQAVIFQAPSTIGKSQNKYSTALNNVQPNSVVNFLLQDGLLFNNNGSGQVVYGDTFTNYNLYPFNIPYIANHQYWADVTYTNGYWWMCSYDVANPSTYQCIVETGAPGTSLGLSIDTSVWLENWNTTSKWFSGFTNPLSAFGAKIYVNQVGQNWSSQARMTADACSSKWPPKHAISGSLIGGNTGYFHLAGVPLYC